MSILLPITPTTPTWVDLADRKPDKDVNDIICEITTAEFGICAHGCTIIRDDNAPRVHKQVATWLRKQHGVLADEVTLRRIAEATADKSDRGRWFDIVNHMSWEPGTFGEKPNSCFWKSYYRARSVYFPAHGGLAIRTFAEPKTSHPDKGNGRALLVPATHSYLNDRHDTTCPDSWILVNCYGPPWQEFMEALPKLAGWNAEDYVLRSVSVYANDWYINNETGYLFLPATFEDAETIYRITVPKINVHWPDMPEWTRNDPYTKMTCQECAREVSIANASYCTTAAHPLDGPYFYCQECARHAARAGGGHWFGISDQPEEPPRRVQANTPMNPRWLQSNWNPPADDATPAALSFAAGGNDTLSFAAGGNIGINTTAVFSYAEQTIDPTLQLAENEAIQLRLENAVDTALHLWPTGFPAPGTELTSNTENDTAAALVNAYFHRSMRALAEECANTLTALTMGGYSREVLRAVHETATYREAELREWREEQWLRIDHFVMPSLTVPSWVPIMTHLADIHLLDTPGGARQPTLQVMPMSRAIDAALHMWPGDLPVPGTRISQSEADVAEGLVHTHFNHALSSLRENIDEATTAVRLACHPNDPTIQSVENVATQHNVRMAEWLDRQLTSLARRRMPSLDTPAWQPILLTVGRADLVGRLRHDRHHNGAPYLEIGRAAAHNIGGAATHNEVYDDYEPPLPDALDWTPDIH